MRFLYPYFLWGLCAVAIPVLIHLFNFRRFKKVYFTNVAALTEAQISTRKHNRLKQILLLLVRCLAVVFLTFLFAQPYIYNEDNVVAKEGRNAVVVFVDNSFSMENAGQSGRLLDDAKSKARQIVEQFDKDDEFLLLTMDMEGKHKHYVDKTQFLTSLNEIDISPATLKTGEILRECNAMLQMNNAEKRLFIISDFQTSGFDVTAFEKSDIKTCLLPVAANNVNNVFVDSVWFASDFIHKGQNVEITARITNWADADVEKLPVKLFINDIQTAITSLDIDSRRSETVTMSFKLDNNIGRSLIHGRISILDNPVTFDDDFYFAFNVDDKLNVCLINSNKYIERLFEASQEVNLIRQDEQRIDYNSIPNYSLLILNGLKQITSGLTAELQRYCKDGGTLIVIPTEDIDVESYRKAMLELQIATYDRLIDRENRVSVVNNESSLYKGVFSATDENMEMPKVKRYFVFQKGKNISQESIMKMQSGDDFLCESRIGKGRVYIFASPLTDANTDFINQSLFVPTLWNMALWSSNILPPYFFLSDTPFIDLTGLMQANNQVLKVESINGRTSVITQAIKEANHTGIMLHNQIKTAGSYNIIADTAFATIAFDYDRSESRLEFLTIRQLQSLISKAKLQNITLFNPSKPIDLYFKQSRQAFNFTALFIGLILLCLAVEIMFLYQKK
ncbi:MAG: BatA and WFA domain-containing protein [Bacteroidales bacterium]|jgi:hypothetical protein|nr:BatA and WFA domain-containing protein [Bacteroidales bacterium]